MSKRLYPSRYGADSLITSAQYLSEFVLERQAKKDGKVLFTKFWNHIDYANKFVRQITAANKLLVHYDCVAIMNFLRSREGSRIYSLGLYKPICNGVDKMLKEPARPEQVETITDDFNLDEVDVSEEIVSKPDGISIWEKLNG